MKKLYAILLSITVLVAQLLIPAAAGAATTVSITSPSNSTTVTGTSFTVTGTATADRKITVKVDGTEVGTTTSDASGNWSLEVTGQTAGSKTIEATASVEYIYVPNSGSSNISIINTVTDQVVNTISTDVPVSAAYVSPDGNQMVAYQTFGIGAGSAIRVYSLADPESPSLTNSLSSSSAAGAAPALNQGVWSADSSKFYVANADFGDGNPSLVSVYDGTDFSVAPTDINGLTNSCPVPVGIDLNSDGSSLFVNCLGNSTVRHIATATDTFAGNSIDLTGQGGSSIGGFAGFGADGTFFVSWNAGPYLYPVDVTNETVGTRIAMNTGTNGAAINNAGNRLIAGTSSGSTFNAVNLSTQTVIDTQTVSGRPNYGAFNSDDTKAYISNATTGELMVFSASDFSSLSNITVGTTPQKPAPGPLLSTSTSVTITLASSVLADTGQPQQLLQLLAIILIGAPVVLLVKRYATSSSR